MGGLSVVIPTKDKPESLRATLACLLADGPPSAEIVVVSDGEGPVEVPADAPVRVVEGPRRGRAAARNAGARAAGGTRLLFVDDDILTGPGFLSAHAAHGTGPGFVHGPLMEFPVARRWLAAHGPDPVAAAAVLNGGERLAGPQQPGGRRAGRGRRDGPGPAGLAGLCGRQPVAVAGGVRPGGRVRRGLRHPLGL
ncbi:hypothetical protein SSPO_022480 [Streptomyces antimycoticus]|uniref:4,4'-diaponeurosporenoate glycosyltransferase n=1 Tax=Streptomyces antimycoticus TaxID=68175 RepID=A0A499UH97_9ACTN|nr:hypothetical protein SSPO_022480 [Streptomyces antimycoticus]